MEKNKHALEGGCICLLKKAEVHQQGMNKHGLLRSVEMCNLRNVKPAHCGRATGKSSL